jgi:hypothetical protein
LKVDYLGNSEKMTVRQTDIAAANVPKQYYPSKTSFIACKTPKLQAVKKV